MSLSGFPTPLETPFITHAQLDALSQEYSDQIQSLQGKLRAVHSARNGLASVNRLPPEILGEIFVAVVESYAEKEYYSQAYSSKTIKWLGIAHVCRHWRQVALACSRVWSFIPLQDRYLSLVDTLLKRSRRAPLTMIQPKVKEEDLSYALEDIAFAHLDRAKTLAAVLTNSAIAHARQRAGLDAPLLNALTVSSDGDLGDASLIWLTQASWPRLHSLECSYGGFPILQALLRPTLTSLIVESIQPGAAVQVFLDLLSALPRLTTLKIDNCLAPTDSPPTALVGSSAPIVSLSHLRLLDLREGTVGISGAHLLNHLNFPSDAEIHLSSSVAGTAADALFIVSAFAAKASAVPGSMASAKAFSAEEWLFYGTRFCVYSHVGPGLWDGGRHILWDSCSRRILPTATLSLMGFQRKVVGSFLSQYPLSEVHTVSCQSVKLDEMKLWRKLAQLPNVQDLQLGPMPRAAFACFLECLQEPGAFPSLQLLRLSRIVWSNCHSCVRRQALRVGAQLPRLLRALTHRQQRVPRLRTLHLQCAINLFEDDEEDLKRLGGMVDEFRWSEFVDPDVDDCSSCRESNSETDSLATDTEESGSEDLDTDETDASDDDADGEGGA